MRRELLGWGISFQSNPRNWGCQTRRCAGPKGGARARGDWRNMPKPKTKKRLFQIMPGARSSTTATTTAMIKLVQHVRRCSSRSQQHASKINIMIPSCALTQELLE